MKLNVTKEWFESKAHLEDGHEIGAGSGDPILTMARALDASKARVAELEAEIARLKATTVPVK